MILQLRSAVSLFTCSCLLGTGSSAGPSIGIVMTTGVVQVDGFDVPNASALFEGNLVASGERSASLQFSDGTTAVMNPGTKLSAYRAYSVLQHGITMQKGIDKHPIVANGLRISGETRNAVALVGVRDAAYIEVAAQEGEADVVAQTGELVAKVEPGKTASFTLAQAPGRQAEVETVCGDLDENYLLTDSSSYVTYKLQGNGLEPYRNKRIRVTGTVGGGEGSASAPRILNVSIIKKERSCVPGAAATSTEGVWKGATGLLIFVGIGGALLGIGLSGGFGTSQPAVTPTTP